MARKNTQATAASMTAPVTEQPSSSSAGTPPRPRTDTNLVVLTGRLGTAPELRYLGERGTPVSEFRLATSRVVGTGDEAREETAWLTVKCWNRLAEIVGTYLTSGRRVLVTGRLQEERWQERETGQNRSRLVVVAERVEFLDGPRGEGDAASVEELPVAEAA